MLGKLIKEYNSNKAAQDLIRLINYSNEVVFLTGKAGTGKSTLLNKLTKHIQKNYIIIAPTGVAALNVNGQTIHSFFQFEPRPYLPNDNNFKPLNNKLELLKNIDLIIIDEISMVRCDLMNAIDLSLRKNLKSNIPFAGKQLLLVGDLFQLAPVVDNKKQEEVDIIKSNYKTPYFFSAKVFECGLFYHIIELEHVYRQSDVEFINLLNNVRINSIQQNDLSLLNQQYNATIATNIFEPEIILASTNEIVKKTNSNELHNLEGQTIEYEATLTGIFQDEQNDNRLPADKILYIKNNAQVIFVKNDPEKRWVNGSIGKIISTSKSLIKVQLSNQHIYDVQRVTWESLEYTWNKEKKEIEKKIVGTFTQFPLKLAWAITIHKSQGKTFNKVSIDLGNGAFASGQTYVALSRCTALSGITLKTKITHRDIKVDTRVIDFLNSSNNYEMNKLKNESIINGMQDRIDELELLVEKLEYKIEFLYNENEKFNTDNKSLNQKINIGDQQFIKLKQERDSLSKKIKNTSKRKVYTSVVILCLLGLNIYLAYNLFK